MRSGRNDHDDKKTHSSRWLVEVALSYFLMIFWGRPSLILIKRRFLRRKEHGVDGVCRLPLVRSHILIKPSEQLRKDYMAGQDCRQFYKMQSISEQDFCISKWHLLTWTKPAWIEWSAFSAAGYTSSTRFLYTDGGCGTWVVRKQDYQLKACLWRGLESLPIGHWQVAESNWLGIESILIQLSQL